MLKREELSNPQSCLNRAKDHEMIFVLLARDKSAPPTLRYWTRERISRGQSPLDAQIVDARLTADVMDDQHSGIRADLAANEPDAIRFARVIKLRSEAERMFKLISDFVECECSQTSYAELKGSQSMDIPVEFLALCEFAEEMGVKLP